MVTRCGSGRSRLPAGAAWVQNGAGTRSRPSVSPPCGHLDLGTIEPLATWHLARRRFFRETPGGVSRAVHDLPDPAALFKAADILRGSVDAAEYKHLVLGLLFLKYVSESFEHRRAALRQGLMDPNSDEYVEDEHERAEVLDDKDEYVAENVFFIPTGARWSNEDPDPKKQGLLQAASLPDIGQRIDRALELIERENAQLPRGILPRIYARAPLSAEKLGALVETIGRIPFGSSKEARDYLGRTYEYFIATFPVLLRGIGGGGSCGRFRPRRQGPTRDFRAVG
jgi:hypothetical protein